MRQRVTHVTDDMLVGINQITQQHQGMLTGEPSA
jgi:hypothetical protein